MKGYIYILCSEKNSRFYIGSTYDLYKRLLQHDNGFVKATKNIRPLVLKFQKEFETIKQARQIEYRLKKLKSRKILEKIIVDQKIIMGL